jgi:D-ribose pyranose/furanose isomerase RbsD
MLCSCTSVNPPSVVEEEGLWQDILAKDLHLLGHRNWILVVDKAFPEQSSPGMKYLYVEQDLLPTLEYVLKEVEASTHVKAIIYQDKELSFITEEQLAGIEAFRAEAQKVLVDREVNTLLHDEVFSMLDESSSLFRVLVIKTNCTIPYTSVFLQLDCSYWNGDQESALRDAMR